MRVAVSRPLLLLPLLLFMLPRVCVVVSLVWLPVLLGEAFSLGEWLWGDSGAGDGGQYLSCVGRRASGWGRMACQMQRQGGGRR